MIRLSTLLLAPPVGERLSERYDDYRQHGASVLSAFLGCLWASLAWAFMPLETPRWQAIREHHGDYFPHINPHRPRPLDPLRYLLQSLWLLATRVPEADKKINWRSLAALEGVHGRYAQWLEKLPEKVNTRTGHLDKQKELEHLHPQLRRLVLGTITFFSLILALLCITQPFNPLSQFIFLLLLWGVALLVRRIPGRFSALMLIVLSLTVSCRYIWWRYTSTLNWNDPVSLVCGLILLFAETYAWIVLVLGYFQVVWPLNRQPVPLPEDMNEWPTVDIFVPTYNEESTLDSVSFGCYQLMARYLQSDNAKIIGIGSGLTLKKTIQRIDFDSPNSRCVALISAMNDEGKCNYYDDVPLLLARKIQANYYQWRSEERR